VTRGSEQIIALYERHARAFNAQRVRSLFEKAWLDRFAALVATTGNILDIGSGMAEPIARYLIESGFLLTGVGSAPAMIALCRERFPDHTHGFTIVDHVVEDPACDKRTVWLARRDKDR